MTSLDPDAITPWIRDLCQSVVGSQRIVAGVDDDDCAVIELGSSQLVITTDFINSNPIGIQLGIATYYDLGRLSVIANLSDLCGTGAEPIGYLAGVTMEKETSESDFKSLMHGVVDEATVHGVPLIGGDTKLGISNAILGIAIGLSQSRESLLLKSNARVGHGIWVSGCIGSVNAAVIGYTEDSIDIKWKDWAKSRVLRPILPMMQSRRVSTLGVRGAGTDISDGLAVDLGSMCQKSSVGGVLDVESIPFEAEVSQIGELLGVPPWAFSLGGGGDYQFLLTADERHTDSLIGAGLTRIGEIIDQPGIYARYKGNITSLDVIGHRDAVGMTFADENRELIRNVIEKVCR